MSKVGLVGLLLMAKEEDEDVVFGIVLTCEEGDDLRTVNALDEGTTARAAVKMNKEEITFMIETKRLV